MGLNYPFTSRSSGGNSYQILPLMKTKNVIIALLALSGIVVSAQVVSPPASVGQTRITPITSTAYQVVDRGPNHKVWQGKTYRKLPNGNVVTNVPSYIQLATGLNHLVNGEWVDSEEQINVLPNGGAAATNGQHQAYFPGDIYDGVIRLVTPDGKVLQSRPVGMSYDDGTNTLMIAALTNSIGYLAGSNQVIYPNAFSGFKADLRYTYTTHGFEQDVVIRQQPPTPESLSLNADTARLQLLTEFFSAPQPVVQSSTVPAQAGLSLVDDHLGFGQMQMIRGRAFLLGQGATNAGVIVAKQWVQLNGRQFLVEELPVNAIADKLATLPLTAMRSGSGKAAHQVSRQRVLPPQRMVKNDPKAIMMAKAEPPRQGFVMDYQSIISNQTNFTFQGDTTYYISGQLTLDGTNTFEGGTVIKYAPYSSLASIEISTAAIFNTSAYRPAVFTAVDDDTVGATISGSTGSPSGYYGLVDLGFNPTTGTQSMTGVRISYAHIAIDSEGISLCLDEAQFVNCSACLVVSDVYSPSMFLNVNNSLVLNASTAIYLPATLDQYGNPLGGPVTVAANHVTFNNVNNLYFFLVAGSLSLTNCILSNVTDDTGYAAAVNADHNGFYNAPIIGTAAVTNTFYPFQTVGAGNCYLASGCGFQGAGTANIDPVLLASLAGKTTYPPILYSNFTCFTNITLSPLPHAWPLTKCEKPWSIGNHDH